MNQSAQHLNAVINTLQTHRNQAMDRLASAEATLSITMSENQVLRKQIEELRAANQEQTLAKDVA